MDNLDWRNQEHELEENLMKFDSNTILYGSGKFGISGNVYNPMDQFQKTDQYHNMISQWSLSQNQEFSMNPQNGLILDGHEKMMPGMSSNMGSLESLECLLSTSNSQTDNASVEDDGISMIFSDCKNLWNFTRNLDADLKSLVPASLLSSNKAKGGVDTKTMSKPLSNKHIMGHQSKSSLPTYESNATKPSWNFGGKFDSTVKSVASVALLSSDEETQTLLQISENDRTTINQSRSSVTQNEETNAPKRRRLESKHQNLDSFTSEGTNFNLISPDHQTPTNSRPEKRPISSSNINFQKATSSVSSPDEPDSEAIAQMKEMIYRAAAFRPVNFGVDAVEKPKRKNVKISNDPQTVAARQRRERISEKIRVLQRLVPGGSKMDTASMLDEAANYLKFLRDVKNIHEKRKVRTEKHAQPRGPTEQRAREMEPVQQSNARPSARGAQQRTEPRAQKGQQLRACARRPGQEPKKARSCARYMRQLRAARFLYADLRIFKEIKMFKTYFCGRDKQK